MDSNDLERERGITILSKNTAVRYKVSHRQALCSSAEGRAASRIALVTWQGLVTSSLLFRVSEVCLCFVSTAMLGTPAELLRQW